MYKFLSAPLTISGIYKNAWQLYKTVLFPVFAWSLILSIIHVIPYLYGFEGIMLRNYAGHLVFTWTGILLFIALLIVQTFFLAMMFYNIYSAAKEQKVDNKKALVVAKDRFIQFYLANVLYFVIVGIGIFIFVLPGVFFAILFSLNIAFIIIEKQNVYRSFESSARLIWGHWWQTFFLLLVPYGLSYLGRSIVKFPYWWGDWRFLADVIILTFVAPYFYSVILTQYNNLKIIKSLPQPISERPRTQTPS